MMSLKRTLLFLPFLVVFNFSSNDPTGWVLRKNDNGIAVYTRYTTGTNIKEIWVIDTVKSSMSAVIALLLDTKHYPSWVYRCITCKTLKSINAQEEYDYELTDVPWPFHDRDVISDSKISQDSLTKTVTVNSIGVPDYIPDVGSVERIKQFHSVYKLTKLAEGKIRIDYTLYGDPGGNIPAWLINASIVIGPYNTTLEMNKLLPQYQWATFPFIKE
jgi:hypothetical protein